MYLFLRANRPIFQKNFPLKIFLAMKLTILFIFLFCIQSFSNSNAQGITIVENNITLNKFFSLIEQQSGYSFFYKGSTVKDIKVSIAVKNATIEQALSIGLKDQPL